MMFDKDMIIRQAGTSIARVIPALRPALEMAQKYDDASGKQWIQLKFNL